MSMRRINGLMLIPVIVITFLLITNISTYTYTKHTDTIEYHNHKQYNTPTSTLHINEYRLYNVVQKLQQQQSITIAIIGGSNSQGRTIHNTSNIAYNKFVQYLTEYYNLTVPIQLYNHARGGATSDLSSHCLNDIVPELRQNQIDLLFIDYAANDPVSHHINSAVVKSMERITRYVLQYTNHTALYFIYFSRYVDNQYISAAPSHQIVASHYNIPALSFSALLHEFCQSAEYSLLLHHKLYIPVVDVPLSTDMYAQPLMSDPRHASDLGHVYLSIKLLQQWMELHTRYSSIQTPIHVVPLVDSMNKQNISSGYCIFAPSGTKTLPHQLLSHASTAMHIISDHTNSRWQYVSDQHQRHDKWGWLYNKTYTNYLKQQNSLIIQLPITTSPTNFKLLHIKSYDTSYGIATVEFGCQSTDHTIQYNTVPQIVTSQWTDRSTQSVLTEIPIITTHNISCIQNIVRVTANDDGDFKVTGYMYG